MGGRVAVQSRGPRNTHREVTYLQLGSLGAPPYAYVYGRVEICGWLTSFDEE